MSGPARSEEEKEGPKMHAPAGIRACRCGLKHLHDRQVLWLSMSPLGYNPTISLPLPVRPLLFNSVRMVVNGDGDLQLHGPRVRAGRDSNPAGSLFLGPKLTC